MSSDECYDLLIVEAHAVKNLSTTAIKRASKKKIDKRPSTDVSNVLRALRSIRETTIRSGIGSESVNTTGTPGDLRASHFLDGSNTSEGPKITIADPWVLLLDFFHHLASNMEAIVSSMERLGFEAHGCKVAKE